VLLEPSSSDHRPWSLFDIVNHLLRLLFGFAPTPIFGILTSFVGSIMNNHHLGKERCQLLYQCRTRKQREQSTLAIDNFDVD
jgi:hypothetical protein